MQGEGVITTDSSGKPVSPDEGVFPILLELEPGVLKVVGTAFYITRYGLFLTAAHVMLDAFDQGNKQRGRVLGLHAISDTGYVLRAVHRFDYKVDVDIALGELGNFKEEFPHNPLENKIGVLRKRKPKRGDFLITYAYPDNEPLDFRSGDRSKPLPLHADFYSGRYRRFLKEGEFRAGHFEMSIKIKSGASGGPVFDAESGVCGVAVRGWDLSSEDFDGDDLSYAVPITECMDLGLTNLRVPEHWWERKRMAHRATDQKITVRDLVIMGHALFR